MQPSEIAAQPASDSPSTSQVLEPHRSVKPFPGSSYHFTVNANCLNGEKTARMEVQREHRDRCGRGAVRVLQGIEGRKSSLVDFCGTRAIGNM